MFAKIKIAVVVLSIFCLLDVTECNYEEETWVEPNAWGREIRGRRLGKDFDDCPVCGEEATSTENGVALLYYKKFIATLFKRDKLQYDEVDKTFQRSVIFTILPAQLEKLEKINDPRDLDSVLTEIIATSGTFKANQKMGTFKVKKEMGVTAVILDILKDLGHLLKLFIETFHDTLHLLKISEVRFILLVLSSVLLCWFVHHRYHYGYINILIVGVLLFGYLMTYLECNRKLEIDEMLQFINGEELKTGWFSSVVSYFKEPNNNAAKIEKLKNSHQFALRYCRPDHVFIMYVNDLFFKHFEFLIEKCSTMISKFSTNLSFPFNMLAPVMLICLVGYVLKLTFKYLLSPKVWVGLWLHSKNHSQTQNHPQLNTATSGVASLNEDRISGENLKTLLNAIKRPHIVFTDGKINLKAFSGVEEVQEQIKSDSIPKSHEALITETDREVEIADGMKFKAKEAILHKKKASQIN